MNRHPSSSALPILLVVTLVCGYACNDEEKSAAAANTLGISNQKTSRKGGTGKSAYTYKKPYKFVSDWFSPAIPSWEKTLAPHVGKPNLRYLEIGVFEGRSLFWILENVATHPSSRLTGIDIMVSYVSENLRISDAADRIEMIQGRSQVVLRTLPEDSFDIVYIDGSHRGDDVLVDCVLSWPLLKRGGTMILDDYAWHVTPSFISSLILPPELRPKEAIDTFLTLFRGELVVLHRGHQLIARKKEPLCANQDYDYCSAIADYVYDWRKKEVRDPKTGTQIAMTEEELEILETLLHDIKLGEVTISAPADLRNQRAYMSLKEKLNLEERP